MTDFSSEKERERDKAKIREGPSGEKEKKGLWRRREVMVKRGTYAHLKLKLIHHRENDFWNTEIDAYLERGNKSLEGN